jgi:predicted ester cyclase
VTENDSAEANAALVRRLFDEVYNAGRYDVADELIAEAYVSHNRLHLEVLGPEGIKAAARMQRRAFPDQVTIIDDLIAQGDRVAVRGRDVGTHTGEPFAGIEATGKRFEITWIDIFRVEDDRLVEAWLEIDVGDFRRQLEA